MQLLCTIAKIAIGLFFAAAVLIVFALAAAASWADDEMGYDDREDDHVVD